MKETTSTFPLSWRNLKFYSEVCLLFLIGQKGKNVLSLPALYARQIDHQLIFWHCANAIDSIFKLMQNIHISFFYLNPIVLHKPIYIMMFTVHFLLHVVLLVKIGEKTCFRTFFDETGVINLVGHFFGVIWNAWWNE